MHCNARIIIIVQSILSAVEAEGELLGKLFGQGAPAYRSHSGFTGLLASPTVASLVTGPTVASLHWGSYTNTNTNTDCWANCLGKVCQYRSHSGFTGVHRLVRSAWLGKHCSCRHANQCNLLYKYKYKHKHKTINQLKTIKLNIEINTNTNTFLQGV